MVVHPILLLAALAVRQDQTPLRAGCNAGDETIANLSAGTSAEVRFRLADGSDCFKIAVTVDGKTLTGYVPASALAGLDGYEQQRASAASLASVPSSNPGLEIESTKAAARAGDPALVRAGQLIESRQPAQALEILEPAVKRYPKNPDVLLLAGLAAYRADQVHLALDYWKQSLDLAPNDALARMYEKAQRESSADRSGDKLYGLRIALRYEGQTLPSDTARAIVSVLDQEYSRISSQLGCSADERIVAIVQSPEAYRRSTGAAEWSGGQYDGRIHVAWMEGNQVGPQARRTLAHELVHACLTSLAAGAAPWPAWLQEGLAQKLSGEKLTPNERDQMAEIAESKMLPRLENLRQNWSRLSTENAHLAYNLALAAADLLYEHYSGYGIRNIVNNPQSLPQITADLNKKLAAMVSRF